jgi:hypothetical protein
MADRRTKYLGPLNETDEKIYTIRIPGFWTAGILYSMLIVCQSSELVFPGSSVKEYDHRVLKHIAK